jgi:hypothetical protein
VKESKTLMKRKKGVSKANLSLFINEVLREERDRQVTRDKKAA